MNVVGIDGAGAIVVEPDWRSLFSDVLEIAAAKEHWRAITTEMRIGNCWWRPTSIRSSAWSAPTLCSTACIERSPRTASFRSKLSGQITTHNADLAAGATAAFTANNSKMTAADVVPMNVINGNCSARVFNGANGSFGIALTNESAGPLSDAVPTSFAITKTR